MRVVVEFVGRGAKWSLLALQFAVLLNSYLVTGVDDPADMTPSESRTPYVYLTQQEYQVNPSSGQYEVVTQYPELNVTTSPRRGSLKKYTEKLKKKQRQQPTSSEEIEDDGSDQAGEDSVTSHRFENAYTKYNYADNDGKVEAAERTDRSPDSIQDILRPRQGQYVSSTPVYSAQDLAGTTGQAPSYDNVQYQSPLVSYEVPSNYFPSEQFEWPSTYTSVPYGPPHGGPAQLVAPFLSGVGQLTSSVKHIQAQLGEQKAKTAYQVAEVVKGTGHAVNNAILTKGHVAGQVIGQTIQTAGDALASKGWTAQKIIHNKGQLATSAIQSVGNIGSSLLRSKGELIGSVLKTGAAIGTTALGTASNALAGGTYLVKAKGDAASTLIAKGGRLASGVIGTKGRLISNVINAKGQFVAQIVEAKGRAAATLLETSGQKLTQLANAIKSATSQKKPGPGWGWSGSSSQSYSAISQDSAPGPEKGPEAELHQDEEPLKSNYQHETQYGQPPQAYQQDYADTYYNPQDNYQRSSSNDNIDRQSIEEQETSRTRAVRNQGRNRGREEEDQEDFQNDYSSYYLPYHYSPSEHQQYSREPWE